MLRNMIGELLKGDLASGARLVNHLSRRFRIIGVHPLGIGHSFAKCVNCDCVLALQCLSMIAIHNDRAAGDARGCHSRV
jgi:hypothetical protein